MSTGRKYGKRPSCGKLLSYGKPFLYRKLRLFLLAAVLLAAVLMTAGCGKKTKKAAPGEGEYFIYYLDKSATEMYPVVMRPENAGESGEELIAWLLDCLLHVPNDTDAVPAPADLTEYRGFRLDGTLLYVYFDAQYESMKKERMMLCTAALTRTLCQVPGVEHVGIYSGDQMLRGRDGTPLGPFAANDFIDSISNVNSYETADLTLWFSDSSGRKLAEESRTVIYRVDTPLEELVVEQLIAGPKRSGSRQVFADGTRLLSLSVNDNICYLNFNREFLTAIPDEDPNVTIYALVNSLTELDSVQRVQIAVEGSQDIMLRDAVSLNTLFEANPEYENH